MAIQLQIDCQLTSNCS